MMTDRALTYTCQTYAVTRDPFPVGDPSSVQRWMEGEPAEAARAESEDAWLDRILGTTP